MLILLRNDESVSFLKDVIQQTKNKNIQEKIINVILDVLLLTFSRKNNFSCISPKNYSDLIKFIFQLKNSSNSEYFKKFVNVLSYLLMKFINDNKNYPYVHCLWIMEILNQMGANLEPLFHLNSKGDESISNKNIIKVDLLNSLKLLLFNTNYLKRVSSSFSSSPPFLLNFLKYLSGVVKSYGRNVRVDGYIGITNIGGATCYLLSILQQVSSSFLYIYMIYFYLSHIL
jgi:hypothetical protein